MCNIARNSINPPVTSNLGEGEDEGDGDGEYAMTWISLPEVCENASSILLLPL